jgi:hypothetical protein
MGNAVLSGKLSEQAALAEIRGRHMDPKLEDVYVSAIRGAGNEIDSNIAKAERDNRLAAKNWIASGKSLADMPASITANLDAYDIANLGSLQDRIKSMNAPDTDWSYYDKVSRMTDAELLKENPIDLRNKLGDQQFTQVEGRINDFTNNNANAMGKSAAVSTQVNTAIEQMGLGGEASSAQRGQFTGFAYQALDQAEKDKGAPLDYAERQKIIDRVKVESVDMLKPTVKPLNDEITTEKQLSTAHDKLELSGDKKAVDRGLFDDAVTRELGAEQQRLGRELTQADRQKIIDGYATEVEVPGKVFGTNTVKLYEVEVPADFKMRAEEKLTAQGIPVTDIAIRKIYVKWLANQNE